jgi:isoquinoline 1-oxidoreductase beta subunit
MDNNFDMQITENGALSRRNFLVSAGGAGIAVAFGALPEMAFAATANTFNPTAWVGIGTDGMVTIMAPACEMGQGVMTVLPLLIAEELDVDWRKVRTVQSPSLDKIYGNPAWGGKLTTYGSSTVFGYWEKLRLAGAQARKVLIASAAASWKVPAAELSTENGVVIHKKSGKKISYAQLAKIGKMPDGVPDATKDELKPASAYRYIGKDVARVDVPWKVNGSGKYGQDTELPGMLYAAVLHPPVQGETAQQMDDSAAKAVKGIKAITIMPFGVAIIGDTVEGTKKAKALLEKKVTWTTTAAARNYTSSKIAEEYRQIAADKGQKGFPMVKKGGDAPAAVSGAAKVISAEFINDHVSHTCMEPMNATAVVNGDQVEIWASNQSPSIMQALCSKAVGTTPEKVKVNTPLLGGGFGRRSEGNEVVEAALLAKAMPGTPIKVIWSREDDIANDTFRPLGAQRIEIGLDASGNIVGWHHRLVCASVFKRTAPEVVQKTGGMDPVAAGGGDVAYGFPAQLVEYIRADRGIEVGAWRGISPGYMVFAIEAMINELADAKGVDPVAYRLDLLKNDARATAVVKAAAEMSGWGKRKLPAGHAMGFAYSNLIRGYQAGAVEASVDPQTGVIKVHNMWAAVDCGRALQPHNVMIQMEGSMLFGLGAALIEQLDIVNGEVQQVNFNQYKVQRMADIPPLEIKIIASDAPPTGMGEAGVAIPAPAIAAAVATLTGGKRLRQLPMSPARVKATLSA